MKQIAKTQQVVDRLRAAFGPDVDVASLPVYEAIALNTLPLRKSAGIFKGAVNTPQTLTDMASAINAESKPIQVQHDTSPLPVGRVFFCEVLSGSEARVLFTCTNADRQAEIEAGTVDQVSVGFMPKAITCSACGFDYLGADSTIDNLWTLTCADGHVLNEGGVHAVVDGVAAFYELSLVGSGAALGARIVGPSESRLQTNDTYRLAASQRTDGIGGVFLTATQKEPETVDKELLAQLTAATSEAATVKVQLTAALTDVTRLNGEVTALQASVTDLQAQLSTAQAAVAAAPKQADLDAAVSALKAEATAILTACGKEAEVAGLEGKDVTALLSVITENRAAFAAAVPVGGRSKPANQASDEPVAPSATAAFSTRR